MILLLLVAVLLQDEARSEWEGFAEGSTVTLRVTESDGQKQDSSMVRFTIAKVAADTVTVKQEIAGRGAQEIPASLKKDDQLKKTGTENIDIDGKTFACTVYEKTVEDKEKRTTRTLKEWMSKDLPGRVAKAEMTVKMGGVESKSTAKITRLNQKLQVGSNTITYAIWEFSEKADDGRERSGTRWLSEQVPGFVVKQEERWRRDGSTKELTRVTELVEFQVK